MAPRANWKGYLRLSLVSCPIALYPATTESEKVRFHQINSKTGNRIRLRKIDAETEEPVENEDIIKGYELSKGRYLEITPEELEAVDIESSRTIDIDRFVPREEIDDLYNVRPYYIAPEGKVGTEAFVTIREAIASTGKVAIGRLVLTTREHMIALEARGKGLMGTLLRYPYEVREEDAYFEDIPDIKINKDMLDLAKHIVTSKSGHFEPQEFEDRYEEALKELIKRKAAGEKIEAREPEKPSNVVNLMDALKRSLEAERGSSTKSSDEKHGGKSTAHPKKAPAKSGSRKHAPAKKARKAG
jgi:DNA end-binding protein Ku